MHLWLTRDSRPETQSNYQGREPFWLYVFLGRLPHRHQRVRREGLSSDQLTHEISSCPNFNDDLSGIVTHFADDHDERVLGPAVAPDLVTEPHDKHASEESEKMALERNVAALRLR